jgi:hypothetical protein
MKTWVAAGVSVVAATALLAAGALGAFTHSDSSAAPAGDAIAVKGDWKVTVKSANGRVLRVHRFHNEFNGALNIAGILAHTNSTGRYWMTLSDLGGTPPCGAGAGAESCLIFEPDDPNGGVAGWFGNLAVSQSSGQLIITGEIEATRSGEFDHVRMLLSRCGATVAPSSCMPGAYGNFSTRTLASPITLIAGQQAIVTVTYTFSAA